MIEGLNYFANQVGFAVDNIVRVQLVLPNGQFVTASAQTNPDLFFAVRVCTSSVTLSTNTDDTVGRVQQLCTFFRVLIHA